MKTPIPNILIISSQKSEIKKVESFIESIFDFYNLPKNYFNKVFLCTSEAIMNAIVHGNRNDKNKKIELKIDCKNNLVKVKITDEGNGFQLNEVPNPILKKNILKESGRGIHIIKSIAEQLSYNEKGNSLQFQIDCK